MGKIERYRPGEDSNNTEQSIFGPAPLLEDEDAKAYERLSRRVFDLIKPSDIIEEILTRDYVDLGWELLRLRRVETHYFPDVFEPAEYFDIHSRLIEGFPDHFQRVQLPSRLGAVVEQRRNAVLREIEYHRTAFVHLLQTKPEIDLDPKDY